jgi:hypothetical protein
MYWMAYYLTPRTLLSDVANIFTTVTSYSLQVVCSDLGTKTRIKPSTINTAVSLVGVTVLFGHLVTKYWNWNSWRTFRSMLAERK